MAFKSFHRLQDFFLILFSSSLLVLSFPKFDLGLLCWGGLLPLLIAIYGKSPRDAFLYSLVCGLFFFVGLFSWILSFPGFTFLQQAALFLYLACYFGFFGLAFNFICTRWSLTSVLWAAPFVWVSLEYIRSNLSFLALPWGLLAHSQYKYPMFIQIASIAGTYSISFLIVMANCALAALVLPAARSLKPQGIPGRKVLVSAATVFIALALFYGHWILSLAIKGDPVRISVVQGNIDQSKKWDPSYARAIMQTYAELTQEAAKDRPSLIIWPETASPGAINQDIRLYMEVKNIAEKAGTYILLGSSQHQKFETKGGKEFKYLNSAYLIYPDPKIARTQRYDKIILFPFGEYLPFKEFIPWPYFGVPNISEYVPGREFTVFKLPDSLVGVTICWENVFPDLARQFVKCGAQFMINITNEAWFGKSAAPYQLVAISVFRAVENRIFWVRCANTGVSCIIDPCGRIIARVQDDKGEDTFIRGMKSGWVIPLHSNTIYNRCGDLLIWVAFIGSALFIVVAWRKGHRSISWGRTDEKKGCA